MSVSHRLRWLAAAMAVAWAILAIGAVRASAADDPGLVAAAVARAGDVVAGADAGESLEAEEDPVGRLVLEARVNGDGPFRFIVDTGANHTAVSPDLVTRLGLEAETRAVKLNGLTGADDTSAVVALSSFVAGRFARADVAAVVVQPRVLAGADGLLGANLLTNTRVTFDFVRRRVTIRPSGDAAKPIGRRIVSEARFDHGGLVAVKSWIGGVKTTAIIDTGAQNTFGNRVLEAKIPPDRLERWRQASVTVMGVTAHETTARAVLTPRMRVGRSVIRNATVMFGDFHVFDFWELKEEPAMLIGMDVLGVTRALTIDYGRERVIMDPRVAQGGIGLRTF